MSDTTHEAPERMWIDPDILPSEWHKQYHCDVEYVRIDLVEAAEQQGYASAMEAERKLHEARIEELEAEIARLRQLVPRPDQTRDELVWRDHMRGVPLEALAKEFGVTRERMRHTLKRTAERRLHLKGETDE